MRTNLIATAWEREDWRRPSVVALVVANLLPIAGVIFFRWEVFPIIFLFWVENLVIGAFNALKLLFASPGEGVAWAAKAFMVPFFCVHYGIFSLVHGMFVIVLFGRGSDALRSGPPNPELIGDLLWRHHLGWAVLGLVVSHGVSFVSNYLLGGEYRTAKLPQLMVAPYARIIILHVTILLGGFLLLALGSPGVGLVLLVVLKILVDLGAHVAERRRLARGVRWGVSPSELGGCPPI